MSPRRPQWPPLHAPRTTTSPHTQALIDTVEERHNRDEHVEGLGHGELADLLDEIRRLQEHESRLRQDLEGTYHLVRLLYASRDAARTKLEAIEGGTTRADNTKDERG